MTYWFSSYYRSRVVAWLATLRWKALLALYVKLVVTAPASAVRGNGKEQHVKHGRSGSMNNTRKMRLSHRAHPAYG